MTAAGRLRRIDHSGPFESRPSISEKSDVWRVNSHLTKHDETGAMTHEKLWPVHPGEVLLEEFLKPMGLSKNRAALDMGVPARRINEIVLGKRWITADTALRLGRFFWDLATALVGPADRSRSGYDSGCAG